MTAEFGEILSSQSGEGVEGVAGILRISTRWEIYEYICICGSIVLDLLNLDLVLIRCSDDGSPSDRQ